MNSTVQYPTIGAPNSNHTNGQERTKSVQRMRMEFTVPFALCVRLQLRKNVNEWTEDLIGHI